MGKKQHQKDKLYLTSTEWRTEFGGYKGQLQKSAEFRRLPFYCCSLSFQPFQDPLCTKDGVIFDIMNIVPFLKKYGVNPVNGEKMTAKDLIHLNFYKNKDDKFHCPVTFQVFNQNSSIVAIKTTGNVFSKNAVAKLNLKPNHLKDLLSDEPFSKADIINIQDPTDVEKCNFANFYHFKHNLKVTNEDKADSKSKIRSASTMTQSVLDELEKTYKAPVKEEASMAKADKFNAAHYSTGQVAASFTSTAMNPVTEHETALIDEDILRYERVKKKGYVKLDTNYGPLNIELYCDMVPKTCENFLKHCKNGYYKGSKFHRSIRNFVLQGGDPTGTGLGGESIWGGTFKDEFKPNLQHTGRGILSMANSGPNTNKSQFFITFRSAHHLDGKHSVFGRVVGGIGSLDAVELIETDKKDKPKEDIIIEDCTVFVDPYEEADEQLQKEREEDLQKAKEEKEKLEKERKRKVAAEGTPTVYKSGVGKYINSAGSDTSLKRPGGDEPSETEKKKAKFVPGKLGNFSNW
ncbi:RING-type E3 ubiquitin-protein ligase PPIL2-like [Mytilus galloprovincialis]|uniref:RING-type E3 ubiquitin-protein ligase PPIL2 n=2 Tax=Mytilus TaxID=6548 RepID=A0A8B6EYY7_MYTGA|nr:CHP60 [Mytilus edulis]VDI42189.1 peptidyl-prolyl cis-trans isomerase-like 2 [Mytilus galloprovincialis]